MVAGGLGWNVTATALSNGNLHITIPADSGCSIVGWVLHDGSCHIKDPNPSNFCRSPENPFDGGPIPVGPTGLPTTTGSFEWTKCDQ
jgi:hypothetical protein